LTREAFDECLSWQEANTPLVPFTSSWGRAMQKRQLLTRDGMKQVVIVAIWAKGLRNVYDASQVELNGSATRTMAKTDKGNCEITMMNTFSMEIFGLTNTDYWPYLMDTRSRRLH
jgi:hypothetical protein